MTASPETEPQRIFVVDDDDVQISIIQGIFEGTTSIVVPMRIDPREIAQAATNAGSGDVFVVDILLNAEIDGLDVADILAQAGFPGDVWFLSGAGQDYLWIAKNLARARGLTVRGTLIKPIDAASFSKRIASPRDGTGRPD